jgi:ADP-L-glycero-D-manno-heptose 6-epimerase
MSKTAFVTGASGFIGTHLCYRLYNEGYNVVAVGTRSENRPRCHQFLQLTLDGIAWNLVPEVDICFHQAAHNDTTDSDITNMLRANVTAPSNVFYRLLREKKCRNFVYASSASVYGNQPVPFTEGVTPLDPLNAYAESKLLFEQWAEEFALEENVRLVGLRYTNVYGPGELHKGRRASMIYQLYRQMKAGCRPKLFKWGGQCRDWVYVEDVVEANILAAQYKYSGVFNVGAGGLTFKGIVKALNELLGTDLEPEYIDCPFVTAFQTHTLASLDKSKECLKYEPKYPPLEGIKHFVEEMKKAGA